MRPIAVMTVILLVIMVTMKKNTATAAAAMAVTLIVPSVSDLLAYLGLAHLLEMTGYISGYV